MTRVSDLQISQAKRSHGPQILPELDSVFSVPTLQFSRETTPNLLETFSEAILGLNDSEKRYLVISMI